MRARRWLVVAFAAAGLCVAVPSPAEIWGYVDEQGQSHVATEKLDTRYELIFKGRSTADVPEPPAERADLDALRRTPLYLRLVDDPEVKRLDPLIRRHARAHRVDPALVKAVVAVESGFRADAVSEKGALGLMQVIPDTAARYGVATDRRGSVRDKLFDPATNIGVGVRYLRDLLTLFGDDVTLALAAYNAGEQAVARYANAVPPFAETREFVRLVQQFYEIYRPPAPPPPPGRIAVPSRRRMP